MQGEKELPELVLPVEERDHCLGRPGAKYSLVEYGDFASPHSSHLYAIVKEVVRELGADLCFAFRHYPLPARDQGSERAAEAAEAAGLQAKFWLFHDRLFESPVPLTSVALRTRAADLGLDMETYDRDLRSGEAAKLVAVDVESGNESGVGDTPTLFVNGRLHVGSYEFLPLVRAIEVQPSGPG